MLRAIVGSGTGSGAGCLVEVVGLLAEEVEVVGCACRYGREANVNEGFGSGMRRKDASPLRGVATADVIPVTSGS